MYGAVLGCEVLGARVQTQTFVCTKPNLLSPVLALWFPTSLTLSLSLSEFWLHWQSSHNSSTVLPIVNGPGWCSRFVLTYFFLGWQFLLSQSCFVIVLQLPKLLLMGLFELPAGPREKATQSWVWMSGAGLFPLMIPLLFCTKETSGQAMVPSFPTTVSWQQEYIFTKTIDCPTSMVMATNPLRNDELYLCPE